MKIVFCGSNLDPRGHRVMIEYADRIIGCNGRGFGQCKTMGVIDGQDLIGVVVFHNYQPECGVIEISAASTSKRWLSRRVLDRIFTYAFEDCECQLVVARISEDNKPLHRIFHAYGFKSILFPRLRGRNEDERIFSLTDDDWQSGRFRRNK